MPLVLGGRMHPSERDAIEELIAGAQLPDTHVRILGFVEDRSLPHGSTKIAVYSFFRH